MFFVDEKILDYTTILQKISYNQTPGKDVNFQKTHKKQRFTTTLKTAHSMRKNFDAMHCHSYP